jgi:2-polyprenyl-6-methoxyphenol hydroxylase-like FAD-dependent oxidoreductase
VLNPAPRVVVVGGSLSGLFHAIALRSLGCGVEVFVKSAGLMNDRGAGIVLQGEVVEFFEPYKVGTVEEIGVAVPGMAFARVCLTGDGAFVPSTSKGD